MAMCAQNVTLPLALDSGVLCATHCHELLSIAYTHHRSTQNDPGENIHVTTQNSFVNWP